MPQRPAQPIQPPHHQRVPRTQIVQTRIKLRTMTNRPRPRVVIDPITPARSNASRCNARS
jgi:hypothetical protein